LYNLSRASSCVKWRNCWSMKAQVSSSNIFHEQISYSIFSNDCCISPAWSQLCQLPAALLWLELSEPVSWLVFGTM
jgi:hypothetical protein